MRFELGVAVEEAGGLGEAEAVDGLLDVADGEEVGEEG